MGDPGAVHLIERTRDRRERLLNDARLERTALLDVTRERGNITAFARDEGPVELAVDAEIVDASDAFRRQRRHRPHLGLERAPRRAAATKRGVQDLDRAEAPP